MNIINSIKEMDNKKRAIGIGIISFILIILFSLILNFTFSAGVPSTFYGIKLNDVEIEDLTLSDIKITEDNGITKYEASISSKKEKDLKYIKIVFKDANNNEIVSLIGYVGSKVTGSDVKKIEASTDANLSNIKTIEYEVIS